MTLRTSLAIIAAIVLTATCAKKNSNPVSPTPDQSQYEPLGEAAPRHYAGETGGDAFPAWIRLIAIDPPRGSKVVAEGNCPTDCLIMRLETGTDDNGSVGVEMAYSLDGETPISDWISAPSSNPAGGIPNPNRMTFGPWRFYQYVGANAPKYRIFRFRRGVLHPVIGYARILLDYK